MMLSIAEILSNAGKQPSKAAKVEYLKQHNSLVLRDILVLTYSPNVLEFDIPSDPPPYKPSDLPESQGVLHREGRKLKYFVKGYGGNLPQIKREKMFIDLLENVDKDDALVLLNMIKQKPFPGLRKSTLIEAFGNIFPTKADENGTP